MTVYIDDMYRYPIGRFRGMRMSHMIADTDNELHAMAEAVGLRRSWYQGDHYDVPLDGRAMALQRGAVAITYRQASAMRRRKTVEGVCGDPSEAVAWLRIWLKVRRLTRI